MAAMDGDWIAERKHLYYGECLRAWADGATGDFKSNPILAAFKGYETQAQHWGDALIGEIANNFALDEISSWQAIDAAGNPTKHNFNGRLTAEGADAYMSVAALYYAYWSKLIQDTVTDLSDYNFRELSIGWGDFGGIFNGTLSYGASYYYHCPPQAEFLINQYLTDAGLTSPTIETWDNISTNIGGTEFFFSPFLYAELDATGRQWWRDNILANANGYLIIAPATADHGTLETELDGLTGFNAFPPVDDPIATALGVTAKAKYYYSQKPYIKNFVSPISIGTADTSVIQLREMPTSFTLDDITVNGASLANITKTNDQQVSGDANAPARGGPPVVSFNSGSSVTSTSNLDIIP